MVSISPDKHKTSYLDTKKVSWRHVKSPNEKSPKFKLGLRVVLTACRRCKGIENIALDKLVRLVLKLVGLLSLFYSRTFCVMTFFVAFVVSLPT